ncbi:MAG: hypothetical protein WCP97_00730 [bacterium]
MRFFTSIFSAQNAQVLLFFFSFFFLFLWFGTVVWVYQDLKLRTRSQLLFTCALLLAICFPFAGLIFYFLFRPHITLEEQQFADWEKMLLYHEIKQHPRCPYCTEFVEKDFVVCPSCLKNIRSICRTCDRVLELAWEVCPFCASRPNVAPVRVADDDHGEKVARKHKSV